MAIITWQSNHVTIKLDADACKGHGNCAEHCPGEVYDIVENKAVAARIDDCIECCTCVAVCPEHALEHSSCG